MRHFKLVGAFDGIILRTFSAALIGTAYLLMSSLSYAKPPGQCAVFDEDDLAELDSFPETPVFQWWRDNNGTEDLNIRVDNTTPGGSGFTINLRIQTIYARKFQLRRGNATWQREQLRMNTGNGRVSGFTRTRSRSYDWSSDPSEEADLLLCRDLLRDQLCDFGGGYVRSLRTGGGDCPSASSGALCDINPISSCP